MASIPKGANILAAKLIVIRAAAKDLKVPEKPNMWVASAASTTSRIPTSGRLRDAWPSWRRRRAWNAADGRFARRIGWFGEFHYGWTSRAEAMIQALIGGRHSGSEAVQGGTEPGADKQVVHGPNPAGSDGSSSMGDKLILLLSWPQLPRGKHRRPLGALLWPWR